jgi:hypothetical protein
VIPTNIYGPHDNFNIEDGHVIPGLIHKVLYWAGGGRVTRPALAAATHTHTHWRHLATSVVGPPPLVLPGQEERH